jgi:ComF family protein
MCGFPGIRPRLDLCEYCVATLPTNDVSDASDYPAAFSRALVPFQYAYPVDRFIRTLKFKGERLYARVLGMLLADVQRASCARLPQILIPVPLHSSRYRERGFNQAREIARFTAKELGMRVDDGCLARVIATKEQSGLAVADRQRNVLGAFRALHAPKAQHVALVDDVLTTGNTAGEAAQALVEAGVGKVELWAIARVPSPGE